MQTTSVVNDPKRSGLEDAFKLEVLLVHEDLPAGLRGKQALDQVAANFERNTQPNGAPVWMEKVLHLPEPHIAWGINE